MEANKVALLKLGVIPYRKGLEAQNERFEGLVEGTLPPSLILCQHEPVITLGKNAKSSGVLVGEEELDRMDVLLYRTDRGGQATVHSPGQLVAYPILNLRALGISPKDYVEKLEKWLIRAAAHFGVPSFRVRGKPGIYTQNGKLGALGVALSRGYSRHGIAFNVRNDLSLFNLILPCGEQNIVPVSLLSEGADVTLEEAALVLVGKFSEVFKVNIG